MLSSYYQWSHVVVIMKVFLGSCSGNLDSSQLDQGEQKNIFTPFFLSCSPFSLLLHPLVVPAQLHSCRIYIKIYLEENFERAGKKLYRAIKRIDHNLTHGSLLVYSKRPSVKFFNAPTNIPYA